MTPRGVAPNGARGASRFVDRSGVRRPLRLAVAIVVLGAGSVAALAAACSGGGDPGLIADAGSARCPGVPTSLAPSWSAPSDAGAGPCSAASLAVIGGEIPEGVTPSWSDLEARVKASDDGGGAPCAACVFTPVESAQWGPVVKDDAGAAFVNFAACYARAPGGSDACGRALHQQIACVNEVCTVEACRPEGLRGCAQQALQDEVGCGRFGVAAACGDVAALTTACRTAVDVVTALCAAPIGDAGTR